MSLSSLHAPTGSLLSLIPTHPADGTVLHVAGEIDAVTAPDLCAALGTALRRHPATVAVDLTAVRFLGVAGISVLDDAARDAERAGVALRLVTGPRCVARALSAAGLADRFAYAPTVADALATR